MSETERLLDVVKALRDENGCPWDRAQTHGSLKPHCIEEAAEVICGINVFEKTGDARNLKEELGDLLFLIMLQTQIAKEEGLFDWDDVCKYISDKMIRRHPHVFGSKSFDENGKELKTWDELKDDEKRHTVKPDPDELFKAFDEAGDLIETARKRKLDSNK